MERRGGLAGGGAAAIIRRDIGRYCELIAREEPGVVSRFTDREMELLRAVVLTIGVNERSWRYLVQEIEETLARGEHDTTNLDVSSLLDRLRGLTPVQTLALVDTIERRWYKASRSSDHP